MRESGRVVRKEVQKRPQELKDVVSRLRTSLPLLAACKLDVYFRQYLLTQLILLNMQEGRGLYVPDTISVEEISLDSYRKMQALFAGVSSDNALQISQELR